MLPLKQMNGYCIMLGAFGDYNVAQLGEFNFLDIVTNKRMDSSRAIVPMKCLNFILDNIVFGEISDNKKTLLLLGSPFSHA